MFFEVGFDALHAGFYVVHGAAETEADVLVTTVAEVVAGDGYDLSFFG